LLERREEYDKMALAEYDLWWYKALHGKVLRSLKNSGINKNAGILDAGCGTGGLMKILHENGYENVKGFDLSPEAIRYCKSLSLDVQQMDISKMDADKFGAFEVIISNDILCYFKFEESEKIIHQLLSILKPNGKLILNLPALGHFSGIHDRAVGIVHRIEKNEIRHLMNLSEISKFHYHFWPFLLSPVIYFIRRRQRKRIISGKKIEYESDVAMPHPLVNNLLLKITRLEGFLPVRNPFGSSVFIEITKKAT